MRVGCLQTLDPPLAYTTRESRGWRRCSRVVLAMFDHGQGSQSASAARQHLRQLWRRFGILVCATAFRIRSRITGTREEHRHMRRIIC